MTAPTPGPWSEQMVQVNEIARVAYLAECAHLGVMAWPDQPTAPSIYHRLAESVTELLLIRLARIAAPEWMKAASREQLEWALIHQCEANNRNWTYREELAAQLATLLTYARRFFAAHDGTAGLTPEEVAAWREVVRQVEGG